MDKIAAFFSNLFGGVLDWVVELLNGVLGGAVSIISDWLSSLGFSIIIPSDVFSVFNELTYLSNAGNGFLYKKDGSINIERYNKGLAARNFFISILSADCDKICVENPKHNTIYNIPPYSQQIQPYYFGHPVTKTTRLWLKGLPILMATDIVPCKDSYLPNSGYSKGTCISNKSVDRSKTFPGVAAAMASQWG